MGWSIWHFKTKNGTKRIIKPLKNEGKGMSKKSTIAGTQG